MQNVQFTFDLSSIPEDAIIETISITPWEHKATLVYKVEVKGNPMQPEKFDAAKAYNGSIIRDITRPRFSPVHILAILAWASVFVLSWLLILRIVPSDGLSWSFFAFFFVVALFASSLASPRKINWNSK